MKLWYDRKSKDPTYFIQQGIRNGKKVTTKNVKKIGKHSELLALTDDPLTYAREQVALFNQQYKEGKVDMTVTVDFDKKLPFSNSRASDSTAVNIGYFFLQYIYSSLNISGFLKQATASSKLTFDCDLVNRFLTFDRILNPGSKRKTCSHLDAYYEKPVIEYQHILRFMDLLRDNYDAYIEHLFDNSSRIVKRNTSVCYFDCTNYYFETEQQDEEEYLDEVTGELMPPLRRYGPSKEHRPNPIVQMGLFMDGQGIPISMCINPGSTNEQIVAVPAEKQIVKMFKNKRFIYCADAGLGSLDIRKFNSMGGRAFIVTQSVKKLSQTLKQAVFNDYDYRLLSEDKPVTIEEMKNFDRYDEKNLGLYNDFAYKIILADKAVDLGLMEEKHYKNGNVRMVKSRGIVEQRLIITFSRKMMEYQRGVRNRQIDRAKNILEKQNVEDVKKGPHDVTRFIKRTSTGKDGSPAKDHYELDQTVIDDEEKYDGYYAIATNLEDSAKDIFAINHQRYKIEDCFRTLKTHFEARPVYHQLPSRIVAHFLICYTALLIFRLLECKLNNTGKHYTTSEILQTLKNMNVANMDDAYYAATYTASQVCTSLNEISGLGLDRKYYQPKALNRKLRGLG